MKNSPKTPAWLSGVMLLSGAAGLVYELMWTRMLSLALGSTLEAVCVVLSLFMAGLALGAFLIGRYADRAGDPLKLYAGIEIILGLYCAATPWLFRSGTGAAVAWLLPPTMLMGGTLPVLAHFCARSGAGIGASVSSLYFWNTLGGVLGTVAASFLLVPALGVSGSVIAAAGVNVLIGCTVLAARPASPAAAPARAPQDHPVESISPFLWAFFGLSGMAALAYETIWTRLLALVLGSSVYSFAIILAAFLAGIALGSRLIAGRVENGAHRVGFLGLIQLGIAAAGLAVMALYPRMPFAYLKLYGWIGERAALFNAAQFALAFAALLVPATLMGMAFPWFAKLTESLEGAGKRVGAAYAVNTIGAAAGPWVANLLLISYFGLSGAVYAVIALNIALGAAAMAWEKDQRFRMAGPWAAAVLLGAWAVSPSLSPYITHSGVSVYVDGYLQAGVKDGESLKSHLSGRKINFAKDGRYASVAIVEQEQPRTTFLTINGKVDASDAVDMPTQLLLGHLPLLVSKNEVKGKVLVVGLGSGVTAAAAARHGVGSIEIAEIEPAVVEANRFFARVNHDVLRDSRVRLILDDGRHHLIRSRESYDAIISEPSNPWISGMSHLFTAEFYALGRGRLAPGGIFCQWLHIYNMTPEAILAGLNTFRAAFPHSSVWRVDQDLILLGSEKPLTLDFAEIERRLGRPGIREDFAPMGNLHAGDVLARWLMDEKALAALTASASLHTDDAPTLEFLAPLALRDARVGEENSALLEKASLPVSRRLSGARGEQRRLVYSLVAAGRPEAAAREFGFLPQSDAWYAGLQRDLGEMFLRQGSARAAALFEDRLKAFPRDPAAFLDLARARLAGGDRAGAVAALEGFVGLVHEEDRIRRLVARARREERMGLTYLAMGLGYARINEQKTAARAFEWVLQQDPALFGLLTGENATTVR